MDDRALDDTLEAGGRLRVLLALGRQIGEFGVDITGQLTAQPINLDAAGLEYGERVLVLGKREKQMFEGCVFVTPFIGEIERPVQGLFQIAG